MVGSPSSFLRLREEPGADLDLIQRLGTVDCVDKMCESLFGGCMAMFYFCRGDKFHPGLVRSACFSAIQLLHDSATHI